MRYTLQSPHDRGAIHAKPARLLVATTAVAIAPFAQPARAQSFPSKPVHVVVPFASGGTGDVLIRILVGVLEKRWGQPVIVEMKPGGGTVIANALAAKAPADGYTLLLISNSFVISAKLNKNLPYDGLRAFAPVAVLLDSPQVFAVGAASPHKTLREWLDAARVRAGALSIGTFGPASSQHITTKMLKRAAAFRANLRTLSRRGRPQSMRCWAAMWMR